MPRPKPKQVLLWVVVGLALFALLMRLGLGLDRLARGEDLGTTPLDLIVTAVLLAVVVLVGVFTWLQLPLIRRARRLREAAEDGEIFCSALESDQLEVVRQAGAAGVRTPIMAAFVASATQLAIYNAQGEAIVRIQDPRLRYSIGMAHSLLGKVSTLDVSTRYGRLRLYPIDEKVWWRFKRAPRSMLEQIVQGAIAPPTSGRGAHAPDN